MISRYEILVRSNYHSLIKDVNENIQKGWQPVGGVAISVGGNCWQVIVIDKMEEEDYA